jgi:hypothetical protein
MKAERIFHLPFRLTLGGSVGGKGGSLKKPPTDYENSFISSKTSSINQGIFVKFCL